MPDTSQIYLKAWPINRVTIASTWLLATSIIASTPLMAAPLTLVDGRAASSFATESFSIDAIYRQAENGQRQGLRLVTPQYRHNWGFFYEGSSLADEIDEIAIGNAIEVDGRSNGIGTYYTGLPAYKSNKLALRIGYQDEHTDSLTHLAVAGFQARAKVRRRSINMALIVTPQEPIHDSGLQVYLSVGARHVLQERRVLVDEEYDKRLSRSHQKLSGSFAAGLVLPVMLGELFAVVDYENEASLSIGLRYQHKYNTP
ncbi:MAG: hypothetical protein V3U76_19985 [Granulosicoccus sp.]